MKRFAMLSGIMAIAVLGISFGAGEATAGGTRGQGEQKRGCKNMVYLKHPELKGKALGAERAKCMADAEAYGK